MIVGVTRTSNSRSASSFERNFDFEITFCSFFGELVQRSDIYVCNFDDLSFKFFRLARLCRDWYVWYEQISKSALPRRVWKHDDEARWNEIFWEGYGFASHPFTPIEERPVDWLPVGLRYQGRAQLIPSGYPDPVSCLARSRVLRILLRSLWNPPNFTRTWLVYLVASAPREKRSSKSLEEVRRGLYLVVILFF